MTASKSIKKAFHAITLRFKETVKRRISRICRELIITPIINEINKSVGGIGSDVRGGVIGELRDVAGVVDQTKGLLLTSMQNIQMDTLRTRGLYSAPAQIDQIFLLTHYKTLAASANKFEFDEIGFKCYSQNSEDGILLYIFSLIGTTNKVVVEICAGAGVECNAANLIINHGWTGILFDGDANNVAIGKAFYRD